MNFSLEDLSNSPDLRISNTASCLLIENKYPKTARFEVRLVQVILPACSYKGAQRKQMSKCIYRPRKDCEKWAGIDGCGLCLAGQQADELSLISSALANLTASIEEMMSRSKEEP